MKAQVTAELDFSQTESTTESHKPNQTPDSSAVRSQQLVESTNGAQPTPPAGIPGATTNQPPAQAAAPINGQPQVLAANGQAGAAGANSSSKKESIINYEVDKTVRVTKGAIGVIKRINAAVVLNNQSTTDAKGVTTSVPLTDAQLEKMTALVRETVGFNQSRGDSVNLMNAPFAPEKVDANEVPLWRQPEVAGPGPQLGVAFGHPGYGGVGLAGCYSPSHEGTDTADAPAAENTAEEDLAQLDAIENDQPERPQLTGPDGTSSDAAQASPSELRLEDARKLTRDNPAAVANIVKAWMNGEAPA